MGLLAPLPHVLSLGHHFEPTANSTKNIIIKMPVAREEREKEKKCLDISNGTRCALWRELGILRYLLGSWEGVVEARNIGHDGFLVRTGSSNNVCQKKPHVKSIINWREESKGEGEPQLSRRPAGVYACHSNSTGLPSIPQMMCLS